MQQCTYETKIHDIDDVRKRLMQTWFDFELDIINTAIDQWHDRLRSLRAGGEPNTLNTRSEMNVNLYDSPEHLWKCQCNLMRLTGIL